MGEHEGERRATPQECRQVSVWWRGREQGHGVFGQLGRICVPAAIVLL